MKNKEIIIYEIRGRLNESERSSSKRKISETGK